jgi:hypothetical protein
LRGLRAAAKIAPLANSSPAMPFVRPLTSGPARPHRHQRRHQAGILAGGLLCALALPAGSATSGGGHAAGTVAAPSAAATAAALSAANTSAAATEVAGVRFEPALQLGGARLQLNGAGVRYKAVFKVYAAALYLAGKAETPEAVLAAPGPKHLRVVMLRDIDANELGRLFTRGFQDNAPREDFVAAVPGIARMGEVFAAKKHLAAGESFSIDWVPGTGTLVKVNGKQAAEAVPEPEFFQGLLRIWLGRTPADTQLKDALLGRAASRAHDSADKL